MVKARIGLGCNVGDCEATFQKALQRLSEQPGIRVARVSTIRKTQPIGPVQNQPDFLNAVAELDTSLEPLALLDCLKNLEVELGRVHRIKWGPREIDLDILTFGDLVMDHPRLTLPHPENANRPFILEAMNELNQACLR